MDQVNEIFSDFKPWDHHGTFFGQSVRRIRTFRVGIGFFFRKHPMISINVINLIRFDKISKAGKN